MTNEARLLLRWAIKVSDKRGDFKTANAARETLDHSRRNLLEAHPPSSGSKQVAGRMLGGRTTDA